MRWRSSGGSWTVSSAPIRPIHRAISSRELEPLTSWQLLSSSGVTTPTVGPMCSATTSAGACTVTRQR